MQCDDLEQQQKRIQRAGWKFFFDLGDPDDVVVERKFKDPNGIIFDVNWKGWTMTSGKIKTKPSETRSAVARAKGTRKAGSRKAGRRPPGKQNQNRTKQRRSVIGAGMKRR